MPAYIIAQLRFKNRARYDSYQSRFWSVFKQFDGQLLVASETPTVAEGKWAFDKIVMLAFPDATSASRFQNSKAYQEIAVDRKAGADAVVLIVDGPDFLAER